MSLRIPAFFDPGYAPPEVPSLLRLRRVADKLERLALVRLESPGTLDLRALDGLHDPAYLDAFLHGREPLASSQGIAWSPGVRDATLAMLAGQLAGAERAWQCGLAMNVARGFHHAVYERGSGFCPLNGLALLAHVHPTRKILVIDCDEHGGNGTEEFAARLPNLYNVSIFGTRFGCRGGPRSWAWLVHARQDGFERYLAALDEARRLVAEIGPDLLVYQAGVDCHERDPKSQVGLSTRQLFERDRIVFAMARHARIPLLFLLAGGYQHPEQVARLNANTVRAAHWAWRAYRGDALPE